MITVDSSVWIGLFRGTDSPQTRHLKGLLETNTDDLVLLDLVLMEVLRGFNQDHEWRVARNALGALPVATAGGQAVAHRAAELYRDLRRQGTTVRSPIDLMVGAWCIEHDCALLHQDHDFDAMKGLQTWTM